MPSPIIINTVDSQESADGRMGWQVEVTADRVRIIFIHSGVPVTVLLTAEQAKRIGDALQAGGVRLDKRLI